jgi:hypothetical protein
LAIERDVQQRYFDIKYITSPMSKRLVQPSMARQPIAQDNIRRRPTSVGIALIDTSLKKKMTRGDFSVEEPHVSD